MPSDFEVVAPDLTLLAAQLKVIGNGREIKKKIGRELRKVSKPLIKEIRAEAKSTLPSSGGLAAYIAKSSFRTTFGKTSVKIVGSRSKKTKGKLTDLPKIDAGTVRHPVFGGHAKRHLTVGEIASGQYAKSGRTVGKDVLARGHELRWVSQPVAPGFFTRPADAAADRTTQGMGKVLSEIAAEIAD